MNFIYSRMDRHIYDLGIRGQNGPPSILRPRPTEKGTNITEDKSFDSNIFANLNKLSYMMTTVYKTHVSESPQCSSLRFSFPQQLQKMQGLGATVTVKCISYNYVSEKFELFKRLETNGKGNSPAEINVRLRQYMSSSQTSLASIQCLFALMDTHSPTEKTLKRNIYKAAAAQSSLGKEQLIKNQNCLNEILDHLPNESPFQAIVGCDTVYNNPVHGKAILRGTQSSTPFVEMTTNKGLLIGMESFSQICEQRKPGKLICDCSQECTVNYLTGGPMSDVEHVAAASFMKKIEDSILKVRISHVLTDGCKQVKCGMGDDMIEQLLCVQHLKRGQMRKFYSLVGSLSSGIFGSADVPGRKRTLANAVVNQCSSELRRTRTLAAANDTKFSQKMEKIRTNIIPCISSDHSHCPTDSSICRHQNQLAMTSYLLTDHEKDILQQVIDYRWGHLQ